MKLSLFLFTICPINIIYYALYCCDNKVRLTRYQTLDFSNIYYPDRIEPMRRFESTVLIILFRFLARTHIGFNSDCSRDVYGRPNRSYSGPAHLKTRVSFLLVTTNVSFVFIVCPRKMHFLVLPGVVDELGGLLKRPVVALLMPGEGQEGEHQGEELQACKKEFM